MKKLFSRDKDKPKPATRGIEDAPPLPSTTTPIHQQHAVYREHDDERWEVVENGDLPNPHAAMIPSRTSSLTSLPPGAGPPIPSPRSPSPFKQPREPYPPPPPPSNQLKKKAPVPGTILRALEPHNAELVAPVHHHRKDSSDVGHRDKEGAKKGFWARETRDRDIANLREKDPHVEFWRDVSEDGMPSLTRQIGYLTATSSENWSMVLEVCERSSANEANAKEAVRALRREFKYGEPTGQLSAARLWAIMLRNSTETFIGQSTSRKFLDTLEDILLSPRTSPVVRERIMDVVAAAAYASGSKKDTGFRGLWRKIKPADKPEEGIPFDTDDAMFSPPVANPRLSYYDPSVQHLGQDTANRTPPPPNHQHHHKKRKSPTRNRIIPPEEDIKRLFQECKIGQGNASLLSQALVLAKPEDLKTKDVIQEFYLKCRQSQEIIYAQIPWATAGAERSRAAKDQQRKRTQSNASLPLLNSPHGQSPDPKELTVEENLLAALLGANAEIVEALKQYDDLERVGMEREAEELSRRDVRMDPRERQLLEEQHQLSDPHVGIGGSSSRSPSPAPRSRPSSIYNLHNPQPSLAPPPPHGPRPAGQRTPSPSPNNHAHYASSGGLNDELDSRYRKDDELVVPSAKALGKRRVVESEVEEQPFDPNDLFYEKDEFPLDERAEYSDSDDSRETRWHHSTTHTNFVYDAAAERTRQRIEEGHRLQTVDAEGLVH
ncbi:hypothetical protein CPB85DRAFT_1315922 [Mucidula mucida]|nr:hypothetical protein CPB85DRAFT_1315922 [Mucidula mucida]